MDSATAAIVLDFPLFLRLYSDGRVERFSGTDVVPTSTNPVTGVQSKDIVIDTNTDLSARLFVPKITNPNQKLPLVVYFHGGGFCIETAFSPQYHNYADSLAAEANAVVLSVNYRRAPEHPLPIAYNDSWAAIQWVASHSTNGGPEVWLKDYVDFNRIFFAGDSAGANIAHNMGIRVGSEGLDRVRIVGIVLIHPYFGGKEPIGGEIGNVRGKSFSDKLWMFACPSSSGSDDPMMNPAMEPGLLGLGCEKVLVCVAEKDFLRDRGWHYKEELGKSGWGGVVEVMEAVGEDHVFHLLNPTCDNAVAMLKRVVAFINEDKA
ncbi:probable carboxylesterase 2 [Actinidia eriantha]|uniref:probable carboxylesterase 2 n=1 Tax=Actinidia eriantha TaxID=165200 RepID=UPI002589AB7F|nr:probable carboxylesterase 2 [Actinidia eriantha]